MEYAAIIAAAAATITQLISIGQQAAAQDVRQKVADKLGSEALPQLDKSVAEQTGPSELSKIQEDPAARQSTVDVLRQLEQEYQSGGNSPSDRAALELANNEVSGRAGSDYASLQQSMAQRGLHNSGLEIAGSLQAGQNATNAIGNQALQSQMASRTRALQALEGAGSLSRGLRSDDYRKLSDAAKAQDLLNQFNATQRTGATHYNNSLGQQDFDNRMGRDAAQANALNQVASGYDRAALGTQQTGAGIANAALTFGASQDEANRKKKDFY